MQDHQDKDILRVNRNGSDASNKPQVGGWDKREFMIFYSFMVALAVIIIAELFYQDPLFQYNQEVVAEY